MTAHQSILAKINENNILSPGFTQFCKHCQKITYLCESEDGLDMALVRYKVEERDKLQLWKLKDVIIKSNQVDIA